MPQSDYSRGKTETVTEWRIRVGKLLKDEKETVKWDRLEKEAGNIVKEVRAGDHKYKKPKRKDYHGLIRFNKKYESKREAVEAYKRDLDQYNTITAYDKKK